MRVKTVSIGVGASSASWLFAIAFDLPPSAGVTGLVGHRQQEIMYSQSFSTAAMWLLFLTVWLLSSASPEELSSTCSIAEIES